MRSVIAIKSGTNEKNFEQLCILKNLYQFSFILGTLFYSALFFQIFCTLPYILYTYTIFLIFVAFFFLDGVILAVE